MKETRGRECKENERVKEIEGDRLVNRKFYVTINGTRESFYPRTTACRTKEGELVTDERRKTERWREVFLGASY